jgi:hypothetical protein
VQKTRGLPKNPTQFFNKYGAVVLDECHFFIQDAPYNELSQEILEGIITSAKHCVRIYLTATPDVCLEDIIKLEKKFSYELCNSINNPMPNYQLTAFTSACDAEDFVKSKLSFEDKFRFHLLNPPISIDRWYVRDTSL